MGFVFLVFTDLIKIKTLFFLWFSLLLDPVSFCFLVLLHVCILFVLYLAFASVKCQQKSDE